MARAHHGRYRGIAGRPLWAHADATTPAYLRHDAPGPVIALGRPPVRDPGRSGLTTYIVVPEPSGRREGPEPVRRLVASLDPPARTGPCPVGPTLAALADRQDHLARVELAGCPPDVRAELRLVQEDRAARMLGPRSGGGLAGLLGRPADRVEDRHDRLVGVQLQRAAVEFKDHRDGLEQWARLDSATAWRAEALTQAAELAPTRAVTRRLGRPPPDEPGRQTWKGRPLGAIEIHRDRWSLPDQPLPGSPAPHPEWDRARQADELRVHRALQAACGPRRRPRPASSSTENAAPPSPAPVWPPSARTCSRYTGAAPAKRKKRKPRQAFLQISFPTLGTELFRRVIPSRVAMHYPLRNRHTGSRRYRVTGNFVVLDRQPRHPPRGRIEPQRFSHDLSRITQSRQVVHHQARARQAHRPTRDAIFLLPLDEWPAATMSTPVNSL